MKVESVHYDEKDDGSCLFNVTIEGKPPMSIEFNQPVNKSIIGDCLLLLILFQSMEEKSDIVIPKEFPVSKLLLSNVIKLQDTFSRWYSKLEIVNVEVTPSKTENSIDKTISLFSGGIDSFHTFLENKDEITHIMLCIGLDIQIHEEEKKQLALSEYSRLAKNYDKELLIVTINIRDVFPNFDFLLQHAAILSSLILPLGFKKLYIPASHNIDELFMWGSHPLTDPLFSNGTTEVIHHGAVSRSEKTKVISHHQQALNALRVCNSSDKFNCGDCEKCLRTMFLLSILNRESTMLPSLSIKMDKLKKLKIYKDNQRTFWSDNYDFAIQYKKYELAGYAKKIILHYDVRKWLKEAKRLFFKRS